jgi:hypothetical protein|tara:strand:+ start:2120 stop:2662 length:543 start_codon:yes stop_codon:yes gene_type:complete
MLQKVLSHIDLYTDKVHTIKLPLEEYRVKLLEGFVLRHRRDNNSKAHAYEDYKFRHFKSLAFLHDYIRDFFNLEYKKTLILKEQWGNIYQPMERSPTRHSVDPLNLKESPDYVYIYCVDVEPNSCEFVMEYDDNRRVNRTWHIPLQTNQFIIFPSTQRYFITKNKSSNMNVFLTTTAEYL